MKGLKQRSIAITLAAALLAAFAGTLSFAQEEESPAAPEVSDVRKEIEALGCKVLFVAPPERPVSASEGGANGRIEAVAAVRTPKTKGPALMVVAKGEVYGNEMQPEEFSLSYGTVRDLKPAAFWDGHTYDPSVRRGTWKVYVVFAKPEKGATTLGEIKGQLVERKPTSTLVGGPFPISDLRRATRISENLPAAELFDWAVDNLPASYVDLEGPPPAAKPQPALSVRLYALLPEGFGGLQATAYAADGKAVRLDRAYIAGVDDAVLAESYIGIQVTPPAPPKKGKATQGLVVTAVSPTGPAAKAGIQPKDILIKLGTATVNSLWELRRALLAAENGVATTVVVARGAKKLSLKLAPQENPLWQGMSDDAGRATNRLRATGGRSYARNLSLVRLTSQAAVPANFAPEKIEFKTTTKSVVLRTTRLSFKDIILPAALLAQMDGAQGTK